MSTADHAGNDERKDERELIKELCRDVLDGVAHLQDLWNRWPAHAHHAFYRQCYEDIDTYLEYEYSRSYTTYSMIPGTTPLNASVVDRGLIELDLCLLESQAPLDELLRCRKQLGADESCLVGAALLQRVLSCLQSGGAR